MYGLGKLTRQGVPIVAKTGYYLNDQDSYLSKWEDKWYNRFWQQGRAFNEWITKAMRGPRLSRSNHVCGGCLAIHKEAFRRLAFDPWITRGEDLDYMLDLRMYGSDIWFDNQWVLRHLPPRTASEGTRFRQDIFRWLYEYRKLEYSPSAHRPSAGEAGSLEPYLGPFWSRVFCAAFGSRHGCAASGRPDKKAYRLAAKGRHGCGFRLRRGQLREVLRVPVRLARGHEPVGKRPAAFRALVRSAMLRAQDVAAAATLAPAAACAPPRAPWLAGGVAVAEVVAGEAAGAARRLRLRAPCPARPCAPTRAAHEHRSRHDHPDPSGYGGLASGSHGSAVPRVAGRRSWVGVLAGCLASAAACCSCRRSSSAMPWTRSCARPPSLFTIIPTSVFGRGFHIRNKTCLPKLGVAAGPGAPACRL